MVYKCTKKDGSGPYAAKQTKCELEQVMFMKNSYNVVKLLKHENIIKYKSIYITSHFRKAFLVMELFPHSDLSAARLAEKQIQNIAFKLLDAVEYMHSAGICHRDIKPENILYDPKSEQIKVIDFGVSSETRLGKMKKELMTSTGTLHYKAPEMFKCGGYDELVDEWAVGVTIYRLITGVTPFESDYINTTIKNIEKGSISFDHSVWEECNPLVKELIKGLIAPRNKRLTASEAKKSLWFSCYQKMVLNVSS